MEQDGQHNGITNWRPMRIPVVDAVSFAQAADVLDSATLRMDAIDYDLESHVFRLTALRVARELPAKYGGCLFGLLGTERWRYVFCILTFYNVVSLTHNDPHRRQVPIVNTISYIPIEREIRFLTWPQVGIVLKVSQLSGELADSSEPTWDPPRKW